MKILLVGASGQAHVVADTVEKEGRYTIAGLVDSFRPTGPTGIGYDILGRVEDVAQIAASTGAEGILVAIGDNWTRGRIAGEIENLAPSLVFVNTIHPSCQLARRVTLGCGIVLMAGSIVMPNCVIDDGAFVGTKASLDHDSHLGKFASLGPGVTTGGNVSIGSYTAAALGVSIIHGICIGQQSIIGAGATVLQNIPEGVVAYGTPARIVRKRKPGDRYL
jgi:sugar O-acyltransferase (sialic acid O-acetyltransferase NeuD family)